MLITLRKAVGIIAVAVLAIGGCAIPTPLESDRSVPDLIQGSASFSHSVGAYSLTVTGTITTSPPRRNNDGCLWKFQLSGLTAGVSYVIMNGEAVVSTTPFTASRRGTGSTSFYFSYDPAINLYVAPSISPGDQSNLLNGTMPANPNLILKDSRCPIS